MKNVNTLVNQVQVEGMESIAFKELFDVVVTETINPKASSYERQLKGDVAEAIHEGTTLLMELVDTWDGTGSFHLLFKTSFDNRLKNLIKFLGRNKRKHNTSYDLSLSMNSKSTRLEGADASPILDTLVELATTFDITEEKTHVSIMMDKFKTLKPEQGAVIEILASIPEDAKQSEKTQALCDFYGVTEYKTIQKKVSRAREAFAKYLEKHNY